MTGPIPVPEKKAFVSFAGRLLAWLAAPLVLFVPMLFFTRVDLFGNSDALFYGNILTMISDSLKSGVVFPRWLPEADAGFGSPVMMFYAPLAYIATAFIAFPLALFHMDSTAQLVMGIYASQVACGCAAYLWLKRHFEALVAFTGSLLFVLLPYKLIYIYVHINLAQLWALAILPFMMMVAEDMVSGSRRAAGAYALAFAGLYYTHPLTLIAFGAVPAAFVLWFGRHRFPRSLFLLSIANILGLGICAMQLLPAHVYLPFINAQLFFAGNYSWRNNLFHVDVVLCAYYGLIALLAGYALWRLRIIDAGQGWFWITIMAVFFFLVQKISTPIWEWVTPLQYLQFPVARLHVCALMSAVYLICLLLAHRKKLLSLSSIFYSRFFIFLLIVLFSAITAVKLIQIRSGLANSSMDYLGKAQDALLISTPVPLYKTKWNCIDAKQAYEMYIHHRLPPLLNVTSGEAIISDSVWNPPSVISFNANTPKMAHTTLRQCYFPLWQATDEAGRAVAVTPDESTGLSVLSLPHGKHTITMRFALSPLESAARLIALASLMLSFALVTLGRRTSE